METFNRNTQIAALIVLVLAEKGKLSKKQICQITSSTPNYFDDTIKMLLDANVVKSTLGKKGGYELIADPKVITLLDIYHLYQPCYHETRCQICNRSCSKELSEECFFKNTLDKAIAEFENRLKTLTIEKLIQEKQFEVILKHNPQYSEKTND